MNKKKRYQILLTNDDSHDSPLFLLAIVELLNSAIENVVDRIGAERHILSGRAKDMGSAATMVCLILIGTVWIGMAWSRYFA